MKRFVVWFALIALICAGAVSASTYVGYSGPFPIDNTKGDTRLAPAAAFAWSPYVENAHQLRGQFHAHSYPDRRWLGKPVSDNDFEASYISLGYDFVAETNHHNSTPRPISPVSFTPSWNGWVPSSTELTYGDGVRDGHLISVAMNPGTAIDDIAYDSGSGGAPRDVVQNMSERIRRVQADGGLAFIAHPDAHVPGFGDFHITQEELLQICRRNKPNGISIYQILSPNAESKWDWVLQRYGDQVWAYCEDDYHPDALSKWWLGSTWIGVPGNSGTPWCTIRPEVESGDFYCYWMSKGSRWTESFDPPTMHVSVDNSGTYPVITARVDDLRNWSASIHFKTPYGTFGGTQYTCKGYEKYVRVQADVNLGWGKTLYIRSQPIWITTTHGSSAMVMSSADARAQATSPELHLRYLSSDEMPVSPASGYIGPAFDVTTDSGTVPPAATLQLSFDGEDTSALGGTQYLAIYYYNEQPGAWVKVGGTVDPATATIESPITALGKYCISADLPADTTSPQVFIENPVLGGVVSIDTTVKATVNDDLGAWRVSFYLNDHLLAEDADSSDGWGAALKVSDYCTGDWTLKAEAEDLAGNTGSVETPIYIASLTPPPTVTISSPGAGIVLTGTVTATGTCGDDVVVAAVALKVDDTVVGYADVNGSAWTCQIDTTYLADANRTITATVEDYPGNSASATVPVVINNAATTSPLGNVKNASEGAPIRFASAVVVADSSIVGDGFYAEASNRTSGVKVLSGAGIHVGDSVSVVGAKTTIGHEAVVQAQDIAVVSTGNALPKPIGTYATRLLLAPDSIGKIVKLWGTIGTKDTATPATWFMLNDQSGVAVKCKLASGVTFGPTWTLIAVTGVVCTEDVSGAVQIDLLITDSSSICPLLGD